PALSVHRDVLDRHRRRQESPVEMTRIEDEYAAYRGKPQPPVSCLRDDRLHPGLAFDRPQRVERAVRRADEPLDFSLGELPEVRSADGEDALAARHPKPAEIVGDDSVDDIVEQTVDDGEAVHPVAVDQTQALAERAD